MRIFGQPLDALRDDTRSLPRMTTAGLKLRGVVWRTAVYSPDPTQNVSVDGGAQTSVFCDVLVYSGLPKKRQGFLPRVPVQQRGGVHHGECWIPTPCKRSLSGGDLQLNGTTSLADFDGDHVIVEFLDDSPLLPIITGGITHPQVDVGKSLASIAANRLRRIGEDGIPRWSRFNGVAVGVDGSGNVVVDARQAHRGFVGDGTAAGGGGLDADGYEVANAATSGGVAVSGNVKVLAPANATVAVEYDSGRKLELRDSDGHAAIDFDTVSAGSGATQHVIRGEAWQAAHAQYDGDLLTMLTALHTALTALVTAIAIDPATNPAALPPTPGAVAAAAAGVIGPLSAATSVLTSLATHLANPALLSQTVTAKD